MAKIKGGAGPFIVNEEYTYRPETGEYYFERE